MKKIMLTLFLLLTTAACDEPAQAVEFREAQTVAAKAEDIDVTRKMMGCLEYSWEYVAVELTVYDPSADGLQGYSLTLESNAPVTEVACAWDIIKGWGEQP